MKVITQWHRSTKRLELNHGFTEYFTSPNILAVHREGSWITTGARSWKCFKAQALFKKECLGKPKTTGRQERTLKPLTPTGPANTKHSLTPSQTYMKLHIKRLSQGTWVAQWLSVYLWLRSCSRGPGIKSRIGLPIGSPLSPSACVSASLSVPLVNK